VQRFKDNTPGVMVRLKEAYTSRTSRACPSVAKKEIPLSGKRPCRKRGEETKEERKAERATPPKKILQGGYPPHEN